MILGFDACHSTDELMEDILEIRAFSMILGFPRFPLHQRKHEKCMEIFAFSMILEVGLALLGHDLEP